MNEADGQDGTSSQNTGQRAADATSRHRADATSQRTTNAASPRGAAARVSVVHGQARPTFAVSALFAVAAGVAALLDNRTGTWLPLHLLLAGTVLGAITAATQLLGVTWSSAPPPEGRLVHVQRVALFGGVAMVAVGRVVDDNPALIGIGACAVAVALAILIFNLSAIRRGAVTDRYFPALTGYMVAAGFGIIGVALGATIASGALEANYRAIRGVHLTANALGLVGIVILSTLPFFLATQARMKMAKQATARRILLAICAAAASTALSLLGWLISHGVLAALGAWAYALVLVGSIWLFPRVKRKQFDWAGPRLAQLASGYLWWIGSLVALGFSALDDRPSLVRVMAVMAVGGFAQIVSSSINYFIPVIMAGNRKPGERLRLTRSWVSFAAGNATAIGLAADAGMVTAVSAAVWMIDLAYRLGLVVQFNRSNNDGAQITGA